MGADQPGVYRVHWVPGTDHLLGTCHCGAQYTASDPVELWTWLHGHPVGHAPHPAPEARPEPAPSQSLMNTCLVTA
jgi:hypothetical protein